MPPILFKKSVSASVPTVEGTRPQYDCLSKFFRKYQERVCDYVSDAYYSDCMIEAQNWNFI